MIKTLTFLTFVFIFTLTSCGQTNTKMKNIEQQKNSIGIDTSKITVLPFDSNQNWIFKNCKSTNLTSDDLLTIETILNKFIYEYNSEQEKQFNELTKCKLPFFSTV